MILNIILSLLFTIIVEVFVSFILGINNIKDLLKIAVINIITNPPTETLNLIIKNTILHYPLIILVEILITFIEYLWFKHKLKNNDVNLLLLAISNNVCSYVVGIIFNLNFGGII